MLIKGINIIGAEVEILLVMKLFLEKILKELVLPSLGVIYEVDE